MKNDKENKAAELTKNELEKVNGGFIPVIPPNGSLPEDPNAFKGTFDGNKKAADLSIEQNRSPEGYDCSGIVD